MTDAFATALPAWYSRNARDLPWRRPGTSAWAILVSELMLQQTLVARVLPVWERWMARWPTPAALAADAPGEAVRAWGRLGYPRRALWLHAAARQMVERHGGNVASSYDELRSLPGVGDYTAAAVATFAFGARAAVLDTNVRRVYARHFDGRDAVAPSVSVAERRAALARVPADDPGPYSAAVMELGALVCTARAPGCDGCPVASTCAWRRAGYPSTPRSRRSQLYAGTDRQARGSLLAVLRGRADAVPLVELDAAWPDAEQRSRALQSLLADGLVEPVADGRYRLPA